MALQSSGQISLNDIHIEAGGSSGTQAALNDSDIRGLISASSASEMDFADFYGASSGAEFVGAVTKHCNDMQDIDSSSEALNLTGAGVQVGDLVVLAVTADASDHQIAFGSISVVGMSMTHLFESGNNLPSSDVFYGFWASGNSNIYFSESGFQRTNCFRAGSYVAAIFRNTNTSILNSASGSASSGMPNPPQLAAVSGTKLIVATAHLDDDEVTMTAPSGYTLAASAKTTPSTDDGITGSSTAIAYKITSSSVTENPGIFGGGGADDNDAYTLRF